MIGNTTEERAAVMRNLIEGTVKEGWPLPLIEHASHTPLELDLAVIRLADSLGWGITDVSREMLSHDIAEAEHDDAHAEYVGQWADGAVEWLNKAFAPQNGWFGHDGEVGAFGCWLITEEDEE